VKYANAYLTDRLYGGPEEGGWYYDVGEPIMSLPFLVGEEGERDDENDRDGWDDGDDWEDPAIAYERERGEAFQDRVDMWRREY